MELLGQLTLGMQAIGDVAVASGADRVNASLQRVRGSLLKVNETMSKARSYAGLVSGVVGGVIGSSITSLGNNKEQETSAGEFVAGVTPSFGTVIGAAIGSKIGSVIPVFGNAIGGVIGGIIGNTIGNTVAPILGDVADYIVTLFEDRNKAEREFDEALERKMKELRFQGLTEKQIRLITQEEIDFNESRKALRPDIMTSEQLQILVRDDYIARRSSSLIEAYDRITDLPDAIFDWWFDTGMTFEMRLKNEIAEQYLPALNAVRSLQDQSLRQAINAMSEAYRY